MFAAMWLLCAGVVILRDRGLPAWLGWLAFPVAVVSSMPSLALVGIASPVDVVIATSGMLLWIAAVAVVLLGRAFQSPRAKLATGSAVPGQSPAIAAARVQREKALLDLARTAVYAPTDGTISQSERLQVGQMMLSGLPAVSIVGGGGRAWVEANFKETDLNKMRVGQPAEVSFDAYGGLKLKGHVQSIGAGTGSEFSVLPAQNASGNWVKVTQRVPVRIAIDEPSPRQLIAGLSSRVTVDVRGNGKR
jgi:multidrug resistance efflux pump